MYQLSYGDPITAELEKERKATHERIRRFGRSAGICLVLMVAMTAYLGTTTEPPERDKYLIIGIVATVIGLLGSLAFWIVAAERFRKKFQFKVLPVIAEKVWPGVRWEPNGLLPMEVLRDAELIDQHHRIDEYDGKNLFSGEWAGLSVEMSEVVARERRTRIKDNKTEVYYATIFTGIVLRAERLGHPGLTKLSYREPGWDLKINLPGWFGGMSSRPEIQFGTNDPALGQRFTLESDEPEAGRALVNEELLVTLQKLKNSGNGVPIVVVTPLTLYVVLKNEDFTLSPSYREPIHQQATLSEQYKELQYLLRVVELMSEEPT